GTHLGFQNLVYMYSKVLNFYNSAKYLPNFAEMKPWSSITSQSTGIIPNGPILALDQIKDAASTVKNYIDLNSKLPDNVTVNGTTVNMAQFLELLMTVTLQINSGNDNSIPLRTYNNPINPIDDINEGNVFKTEYLKIANDLKTYMDTTGRTPDYQYQTTLGTHLGFQNLIYMYSRVLDSYNRTSKLPDFVSMGSWRFITSPTLAIFTVDQIEDAAVEVKSYIENNANFLDNVTINGTTVKMSGFLELLMTATLHVNSGNNDHILLKNYTSPSNPMDSIRAGNIFKAEYLKIANDLKAYMDTTGRTPDYQYQSSLGVYLGFQNLVYMYCNMMNFYKVAHYLPDYAVMKPWYAVIKSYKIDVIISGTGGYITNNAIVGSYIQRTELTDIILAAAVTGTPMLTFGDGYGPYVMIVAGVHGNELPAQIAAIKLANYLKGKTLRGTIYIIPFVIPSSTATSSRYWNGMNLNSVANVPGTPTNQILNLARLLNVNALGDFHSTQPGGVPGQDTAMCSLNPTYESYRIASSVSSQTGSVLNSYNRAGVDYPGALEDVCNLSGVPAVTCEVLCSHGTADNYTINKSYNQMIAFLHYENII
ncbi:MAG: succinylglutamate desuccinylase/aspartoacylase family protein, partial [Methanobacterium sp.]